MEGRRWPVQWVSCSVNSVIYGLNVIEKIKKKFDLLEIQTHSIHELRANEQAFGGISMFFLSLRSKGT